MTKNIQILCQRKFNMTTNPIVLYIDSFNIIFLQFQLYFLNSFGKELFPLAKIKLARKSF